MIFCGQNDHLQRRVFILHTVYQHFVLFVPESINPFSSTPFASEFVTNLHAKHSDSNLKI